MLGVEERRVYDDIGGWSVYRPENHLISIFDTNGVEKGFLSKWRPSKEAGVRLYYDGENGNWKSYIKWEDFTNVKNAVRFVYLKRQEPISETLNEDISNVKTNDILNIPGMKGWWAMRRKIGIGKNRTYHWEIYKGKEPVGWINDKGVFSMHYNNKDGSMTEKSDRPNFINNPIKVAQYIWLKTQKMNV